MSTRAEPAARSADGTAPVLDVRDLVVGFAGRRGPAENVVHGLSFSLEQGGALAIVGESGSGKSVSTRALLGLLPGNARIEGSARLRAGSGQVELIGAPPALLRSVRGRQVGMVFQNAMTALNPSVQLERQLTEHLRWHGVCGRREAKERALQALADVGIPEPRRRIRMYPFQLSGGMRQRAMIAMATVAQPKVLIADEPTTALDVTVQKQILDLLAELRHDGMSLIMITHDLGVARYLCDDAVVLRAGVVQERAPMSQLVDQPAHDYSRHLVDASLEVGHGGLLEGTRKPAAGQDVLVRAANLVKVFGSLNSAGQVRAVDDVSFTIGRGQTLGVVGESGSGKSTVARMVMRLIEPTSGSIELDGRDLLAMPADELRRRRRDLQMVFQNPYGSLLPSYTAAANIMEPLRINRIGTPATRLARARELLGLVGLDAAYAQAYPRQLSGGQQQRVAIARALALEPNLLVCDEPTSSLDASVQMQVLLLLRDLQERLGFSMLLITHNLAVVEQMADQVMVMRSGKVVESAATARIFTEPAEDYTRQLLSAVLPVRLTS